MDWFYMISASVMKGLKINICEWLLLNCKEHLIMKFESGMVEILSLKIQNSHQRRSVTKVFLKISQISQENISVVKFAKFLRTPTYF